MTLPGRATERLIPVALLLGFACVAVLLPLWLRMLVSPAPQEMREGAMLLTTQAFLAGRNPYALATLPGPANVYGPLYPLLTVPLAALLGPGLFTHRLVDGLGILVASAILYRVLRREGVGPATALLGAAFHTAGLLYWVGPASRPDGVGMALLLGVYAVLAPAPGEPRRFGWALVLSLLGLATKVYFVFPVLVGCAWTFLFGGWRRGLPQGFVALAAILLGVAGLALLFPGWGPVVLGANLAATEFDVGHLLRQSRDWALCSLPWLAAFALGRHHWRSAPDFWSFALASGVAAIVLALGGHPGAHMTYLFHLVTPPLAVVALRAALRVPLARLAFAASVPLACVLATQVPQTNSIGQPLYLLDFNRFARSEAAFAEASAAIHGARNPTGTTEFAPLLMQAGFTPIETGHSEYWRAIRPPFPLTLVWPPMDALEAAERRLAERLRTGIETRSFDLVLANRRGFGLIPADLLALHYAPVEPIAIDLPWALQAWPGDLWRPRSAPETQP